MFLGTKMEWYISYEDLYIFGPILRAEDVLIREIFPDFYQVTPVTAGAVVTIKDGEQFRAFVWSGTRWVTE